MTDQKRKNPASASRVSEIVWMADFRGNNNNPDHKPQAIRIADDPTMQRAWQRIYDQGPRLGLELLSTLAEKNIQAIAVENEIKHYALLPPGALKTIGCDQIRRFYPLEVPR